jgi:hypothetical protein
MKKILLFLALCAIGTGASAQFVSMSGGGDCTLCLKLSGGTMTGTILAPAGTAGAPPIAFSGDTQVGIRLAASAIGSLNAQGGTSVGWSGVGLILASNGKLVWTSGVVTGTQDTFLARDGAANTIAQVNGNNDQKFRGLWPERCLRRARNGDRATDHRRSGYD